MALDETRFPEDILLEVDDDIEQAEAEDDKDEQSKDPANDSKNTDEAYDEFDGLDLRYATCFGYGCPKVDSWTNLANVAIDKGWNNIDVQQLEDSLMHNIEACYYKIAQFKLENVEDDMRYSLWFDNNRGLWNVQIQDSPKAELTIEQRGEFFKSELFKKIAKRAYYLIVDARKIYEQVVKQHIENGELIDIDVVKLDAILHFIDQQYFLDNLLNGKYLSY